MRGRPDKDVRRQVLGSLDSRFDYFLAQANNLRAIFLLLNDEVRATSLPLNCHWSRYHQIRQNVHRVSMLVGQELAEYPSYRCFARWGAVWLFGLLSWPNTAKVLAWRNCT